MLSILRLIFGIVIANILPTRMIMMRTQRVNFGQPGDTKPPVLSLSKDKELSKRAGKKPALSGGFLCAEGNNL
jgi:hypothetical protein